MPGPSSSRGSVHRAASQSAAAGALHDRTQRPWPRRDPTRYPVSNINGTTALDDQLIEGIDNRLNDRLELHQLTVGIVVPDIHVALKLLENPMRLVASLNR